MSDRPPDGWNEPDNGTYRVVIRRDLAVTKPCVELIDGREYFFRVGWWIDPDESRLYPGEWAMLPDLTSGYPANGPGWIAIGDLLRIR